MNSNISLKTDTISGSSTNNITFKSNWSTVYLAQSDSQFIFVVNNSSRTIVVYYIRMSGSGYGGTHYQLNKGDTSETYIVTVFYT